VKAERTKRVFYLLSFILLVSGFIFSPEARAGLFGRRQVEVTVFFLPSCKACHKVMEDIIPPIALRYGSQVRWIYLDTNEIGNYSKFLSLQSLTTRDLGTPSVLVGDRVLVGVNEAADSLDKYIAEELKNSGGGDFVLEGTGVDLLKRFRSFGVWTVVGAGLADGFNPCAFTVVVFFISFLTLMGYKRHETALIGALYIVAVFLTYLALGFGFFKAFYMMRGFHTLSKVIYLSIGALSVFLGVLSVKDYIIFKKTGRAGDMALQLPQPVKNKIHSIVTEYYRKDKSGRQKALFGLGVSALAVGFLISLLEAVCTGQLYLPTIVFVLKEGSLRARALIYLIIYNFMFILPLVFVLLAALAGATAKDFETYAKKHTGFVKLAMALVFLSLGLVLLVGV